MASVEECRAALEQLADRMAANAAGRKLDLDSTLTCRISDLDTAFHGRIAGGHIHDLATGDDPQAKLKLTVGSDDLVALVAGTLNLPAAWASGRLKIDASFMDLLKLRKLM